MASKNMAWVTKIKYQMGTEDFRLRDFYLFKFSSQKLLDISYMPHVVSGSMENIP